MHPIHLHTVQLLQRLCDPLHLIAYLEWRPAWGSTDILMSFWAVVMVLAPFVSRRTLPYYQIKF